MLTIGAHFTPAELPGTLAIALCGVALGVAAATGTARRPVAVVVACCAAVLVVLAVAADPLAWPAGVKMLVDVGWLVSAAALVLLVWPRHRRARSGAR